METQYQRGKIQEESLFYERLKHDGSLPDHRRQHLPKSSRRLRKRGQRRGAAPGFGRREGPLHHQPPGFSGAFRGTHPAALQNLTQVALRGGNLFAELMETVNHASLGQISHALYAVGGAYRRNM
jgi:methylmalonyl-CoA mutase